MNKKLNILLSSAVVAGLLAGGMAMANDDHAEKAHGKPAKGHHKNKCKGKDGCKHADKDEHKDGHAEEHHE